MTHPARYLAVAAAVLLLLAAGLWYFTQHTGITTDSRKEARAKRARQQAATTSATTAYRTAQAHEDSARHAPAPVLVRPADTARIRRLLTDAFRH